MRTLGKVSLAELAMMERRGIGPKEVVGAILAEAQKRYPKAGTIIINKAVLHDGFDIIAVEG